MRFASFACLAFAFATTGCATITASRTDPYMIYSTPPGATVSVNGVPVGTTPVTIMVDKVKQAPAVSLAFPGYQPQSCWPRLSPAGGYIAADVILCIIFPIIGCVSFIDAVGNWNELEVNSCSVYFAPQQGGAYDAPPPPPPGGDVPPPPPPPAL